MKKPDKWAWLIIVLLVLLCPMLALTVFSPGLEIDYENFDFIDNYLTADKISFLNTFYTSSDSDAVPVGAKFAKYLQENFDILITDGVSRYKNRKITCSYPMGLLFQLDSSIASTGMYEIVFDKSKNGQQNRLKIIIGTNIEASWIESDDATSKIINRAMASISKNMKLDFYVLFLENRIAVIFQDRIVLDFTPGISFPSGKLEIRKNGQKDIGNGIVNNRYFADYEDKTLQSFLNYSRWPDAEYKPLNLWDTDYPYNFVKHIKDKQAVKSVILPHGSYLKYKVTVPQDSFLEFGLFGEIRNKEHPPELEIRIEDKRGIEIIRKKLLVEENNTWKSYRFPLNNLSGKDLTIHFRNDCQPHENSNVICLANPVMRVKKKRQEKNVLLICLDTLRPDHLGCNSYKRETSPNIDRLAGESVLFETAIAQSSWTLPSVASFMTGMYPRQVVRGLRKGSKREKRPGMIGHVDTLAERLKKTGYKTAAFTGNGWVSYQLNFDQGFDTFEHSEHLPEKKKRSVEYTVDRTMEWIENNKNNKWFLFFHTYEIHAPYVRDLFKPDPADGPRAEVIARYDSGIKYTDEHIGRLFDRLRELGLWDDTIIILVSDHGERFFDAKTGKPIEGVSGVHGDSLYDPEIRVPLIIKMADASQGSRVRDQVSLVDILPTLSELLDIEIDSKLQGRSLVPLLNGETVEKQYNAFSENIRSRDVLDIVSLRGSLFKLIKTYFTTRKDPDVELYDIDKEPREKTNMLQEHYEEFAGLNEQLENLRNFILWTIRDRKTPRIFTKK